MPLKVTIGAETSHISFDPPRYELFEALFDAEAVEVHCPICEGTDTKLGPPERTGSVYCRDCMEIY